MKYLILLLLIISCETGSQIDRNTKHTIEWISASSKPIIVSINDTNKMG